MSKDIAQIGEFPIGATPIRLLGDDNFSEKSFIVIDPNSVSAEATRNGNPASFTIHTKFQQRLISLSEWVADGNCLVVLLTKDQRIRFRTNSPNIVHANLFSIAPALTGFSFRSADGTLIELFGPKELTELLAPHIDHLQYVTLVSGENFHPFFRVRTATGRQDQYVGGYRLYGKGKVILTPYFKGNQEQAVEYYSALLELPKALEPRQEQLPEWADSYQTNPEGAAMEAIHGLEKEIATRQGTITEQQAIVNEIKNLKVLFTETGATFHAAVLNALTELGLRCVEGPHGRADILATDGNRILAIETKGLEGSAKESDFRQVERWKAEVNTVLALPLEENPADPDLANYKRALQDLELGKPWPEECKGLLIVNTYRKTPLSDRTEPDFPDGVVRRLQQSDVSSLTGLQLFGIVLEARSEATKRQSAVELLFSTAGIIPMASDWRAFLKQQP